MVDSVADSKDESDQRQHKINKAANKAVKHFNFWAEFSNLGIVIDIIAKWFPAFATFCSGFFSTIAPVADPLIYFFRSLIRLTRLIGRQFGVKFEDEKNGVHKWQTAADIVSLSLFISSIVLFAGAILAPPIGITVAWTLALAGLTVIGHFDYSHQEKLAKEKENEAKANEIKILNDPAATEEQQTTAKELSIHAHKEYITKRNSSRLFIGLLVGLAFLLICGSAAAFAPPVLVPILFITSKVASGYLGLIAVGRFFNWLFSDRHFKKNETGKENSKENDKSLEKEPLIDSATPDRRNSHSQVMALLPPDGVSPVSAAPVANGNGVKKDSPVVTPVLPFASAKAVVVDDGEREPSPFSCRA